MKYELNAFKDRIAYLLNNDNADNCMTSTRLCWAIVVYRVMSTRTVRYEQGLVVPRTTILMEVDETLQVLVARRSSACPLVPSTSILVSIYQAVQFTTFS